MLPVAITAAIDKMDKKFVGNFKKVNALLSGILRELNLFINGFFMFDKGCE